MEFSSQEIDLSKSAKLKAKRTIYIRYMCAFFVVVTSVMMFMGFFAIETFAVVIALFALVAFLYPEFHLGPNYKDLADLLVNIKQ